MSSATDSSPHVDLTERRDGVPQGRRIVVAGGTGFVGRALVARLARAGNEVTVLSRQPRESLDVEGHRVRVARWDPGRDPAPRAALEAAEIVFNLIGENIGASRWSASRKRALEASRLDSTRKLVEALSAATEALINASAVSAYPGDGRPVPEDEPLTAPRSFIQGMTIRWENAARAAEERGVRVVLARIGVVLGASGMLDGMMPLFRLRAARYLGSPEIPVPWIALDDVARLLGFLAATPEATGAFNVVAPKPVSFAAFSREVQNLLGIRSVVGLPAWLIRGILGQDAAALLLARHDLAPTKALRLGFEFHHEDLRGTLRAALAARGRSIREPHTG